MRLGQIGIVCIALTVDLASSRISNYCAKDVGLVEESARMQFGNDDCKQNSRIVLMSKRADCGLAGLALTAQ